MKILLTGGAGYVGSACLRWLLKHGHEPLAFDDLSEGNRDAVPGDRVFQGDIQQIDSLRAAFRQFRPDAVMHFAAAASVPDSILDPDFYFRQNVLGTKNLLDVMREFKVNRALFSSTAATFAFTDKMPLTEESPQVPQVPYGRTKHAAEFLFRDYARAYGIGCVLLRYFNASGADPDGNFGEHRRKESHLIPLILYVPLGIREKVTIYGTDWATRDGTCVRDFIHTDDLAQVHQLALEQLKPGEQRDYNLGSGTGYTVLEVLRACEKEAGRPITHDFAERRPGDPATLIASPAKAIRELGFKPQYNTIESIVRTAWRWHSTHPRGYPNSTH
jgi:UDP-glucose-4-epimerase GalE